MSKEKMAQLWYRAGVPGRPHLLLKPLIGTWETTTKFYGASESPKEQTRGWADHSWVLGGRFLQEELRGEVMGQPYQGLGFVGYDMTTEQYVSVWMDSNSTQVYISTGSYDEQQRTITWEGSYTDPVSGARKPVRAVTRFVDADKHIHEMHEFRGSEWHRTMEVVYTRNRGGGEE